MPKAFVHNMNVTRISNWGRSSSWRHLQTQTGTLRTSPPPSKRHRTVLLLYRTSGKCPPSLWTPSAPSRPPYSCPTPRLLQCRPTKGTGRSLASNGNVVIIADVPQPVVVVVMWWVVYWGFTCRRAGPCVCYFPILSCAFLSFGWCLF